jgi:hypothetical protein
VPSFTFNFERVVPDLPWRRIGLIAAIIALLATVGWETYARSLGYAPTLNDTDDLWAQQRETVTPVSVVIIGDSRALFDLDLDVLQDALGQRPVQLAMVGSCAYPILADLAADENFRGTVICSIVPRMFFAPAGRLLERSEKALKRYRTWTPAQRVSHELGMQLEERVAFLKDRDLTLEKLLERWRIPNRAAFRAPPVPPPYFQTVDRDRRTRMADACAQPGVLQTRVKEGWLQVFTPPPPPNFIPREVFAENVRRRVEGRFVNTKADVEKIRARGGKVVFVRFPFTGKLKDLEDGATPRGGSWTRLLADTKAPGIYFEDFPELASFDCPEWSHLSAADSVEFTKRLVPHLRAALAN